MTDVSNPSYINPWDALGRVGHDAISAAGDVTSGVANYAKDVVVETVKGGFRLGKSAAATVTGDESLDPYKTPGGGEAWGQMAKDALPFLPYGRIAKPVAEVAGRAAKPIVSKLGELTSYTKPLLPEMRQAAGALEGDVIHAASKGVDILGNIRNKAGSKLASAGLAASLALGNAAGAAESLAVRPLTSMSQTVERALPAVESAAKTAGAEAAQFIKRDIPDAASNVIRAGEGAVKAGENAAKSAGHAVSNWVHNLMPNVGVAAVNPGSTQQNPQQNPAQNTKQNTESSTSTENKPKKEEEKPTKPKKPKPVDWGSDTGGGQNTTIPVIN